jgi:hypothetical protein
MFSATAILSRPLSRTAAGGIILMRGLYIKRALISAVVTALAVPTLLAGGSDPNKRSAFFGTFSYQAP